MAMIKRWLATFGICAAILLVCRAWFAQAPSIHVIGGFDVADRPVLNLGWDPDGKTMVYCGPAGCHLVDAQTGSVLTNFPDTNPGIAGDGQGVLGFSPDGKMVILSGLAVLDSQYLTFWNAKTGLPAATLSLLPAQRKLGPAAIFSESVDRRQIAALANEGKEIYLYDTQPLKLRAIVPVPDSTVVTNLALSPDGKTVAIARNYREIASFDSQTGQAEGNVSYQLNKDVDFISSLAFSPDGQFIAAGFSNGGTVQVPGPNDTMVTVPSPWPTQPVYVWHVTKGVPYGDPVKLCGAQPQGAPNMIWTANSDAVILTDGYGATKLCALDGSDAKIIEDQGFDAVEVPALSPDGRRLGVGVNGHVTIFALPATFLPSTGG